MAKLAKLAYIPTVFIKCHLYKRTPILQENAHIFLFWLNPTGHSKFHNTSNHPPPATDSGRTVSTPLYPPTSADGPPPPPPYSLPPPFFFPCPRQRNQLRPIPMPVTAQAVLNVHIKHSDLT